MRLSSISGQENDFRQNLGEQRKIITFVSMKVKLVLLIYWQKQHKTRKVISQHVSGKFEDEDVLLDAQHLT